MLLVLFCAASAGERELHPCADYPSALLDKKGEGGYYRNGLFYIYISYNYLTRNLQKRKRRKEAKALQVVVNTLRGRVLSSGAKEMRLPAPF